jgi:hypothetical protein
MDELDGKKILFLGGYKGLLRSISDGNQSLFFNSAIFVDNDCLPFGLVEYLGVNYYER